MTITCIQCGQEEETFGAVYPEGKVCKTCCNAHLERLYKEFRELREM